MDIPRVPVCVCLHVLYTCGVYVCMVCVCAHVCARVYVSERVREREREWVCPQETEGVCRRIQCMCAYVCVCVCVRVCVYVSTCVCLYLYTRKMTHAEVTYPDLQSNMYRGHPRVLFPSSTLLRARYCLPCELNV